MDLRVHRVNYNIKFTNKPKRLRYVFISASGFEINLKQIRDTLPDRCFLKQHLPRSRELIIDVLESRFKFKVNRTNDSLQVWVLQLKDSVRLLNSVATPMGDISPLPFTKNINGTAVSHDWFSTYYMCSELAIHHNIFIYNEISSYFRSLAYPLPQSVYESCDINTWNQYLMPNYGMMFVAEKRIEPIYTITFEDEK